MTGRVLAIGTDDGSGSDSCRRPGEDGGVAQEVVEFDEHQLAEHNFRALGFEPTDKGAGRRMFARGGVGGIAEDVGIERDH